MKKKGCALLMVFLSGVCAVIWFVNAIRGGQNGGAVALMLLWLGVTIIWGRRAWKERRSE